MGAKIFGKCGQYIGLFLLILVLLCIVGCIDSGTNMIGCTPQQTVKMSGVTQLDIDFIPEVSDNLFRTEGDIVLWSDASLPYLMINAVLQKGSQRIDDVRYMMTDIEPSKGHHFEISKNRKISQGSYNCTLEILGPEGLIESETRRCLSEFEGFNKGQDLQYIFVSQGEKEPHIISDSSLKSYLSRQDPSNNSINLTQAQYLDSNPQSSLSELLNGPSSVAGGLVGSINSKKYHLSDCPFAMKIKPENKVYFANAEEAKNQGYQPCKSCNP